jgi:hypothetical protein
MASAIHVSGCGMPIAGHFAFCQLHFAVCITATHALSVYKASLIYLLTIVAEPIAERMTSESGCRCHRHRRESKDKYRFHFCPVGAIDRASR